MSGIVTDKQSNKPINRATVNVVGNQANQEFTDTDGAFILNFTEGVHEGDAVRIHVEKEGYSPYDAWKAVSSIIPLHISLEPTTLRSKTQPDTTTKEKVSLPDAIAAPTSSEAHGTTDRVDAQPHYHGTTDSATAKAEHAPTKGPRLGIGPDPYKDLGDAQVGQWAIEEGDKIEDMANAAMKPPMDSPSSASWFFKVKFNDCCAQDVVDLRTEILRRLGPPAKDPDEISSWTMLFPSTKYPGAQDMINPLSVKLYAPYLRRLGLRLKRRETPRAKPLALKFSEVDLPPEKLGYSHILVTIEAPSDLTSGYVAVQFDGQPYAVGCDFQDSKLAFIEEPLSDNLTLLELLKKSTNYVLQVGKTPFTPSHPIHVEARASTAIHAAEATFLEE